VAQHGQASPPPPQLEDLRLHLKELKYPYTDETDNQAYKLFLGA